MCACYIGNKIIVFVPGVGRHTADSPDSFHTPEQQDYDYQDDINSEVNNISKVLPSLMMQPEINIKFIQLYSTWGRARLGPW